MPETLLKNQDKINQKNISWNRMLFTAFLWGFMICPAYALFDRGGVIGVGARAMGLGGAFTAVADDASAAYWNPAGLVQLDDPEIQGMVGSYVNGLNQNLYFSFHYPFPQDIHTAFSVNHSFYPGSSGIQEDQATLSVAIPADFVPEKRLMFGVNFRYLYAQEGGSNGTAQGAAADFGMLLRMPVGNQTQFRAALTLTDISTSIHFDAGGSDQTVPSLLTAGFAYQMGTATLFSIDGPWALDDDLTLGNQGLDNVRFRGGAEQWLFNDQLGLRAGVISFLTQPAALSLGIGFRMSDLSVDGAFMIHSQLGDNYRLSIGLSLGRQVQLPFSLEESKTLDFLKQNIQFSFNRVYLMSKFNGVLDRLADLLLKRPQDRVVLTGYASGEGTPERNQNLSQWRAEEVRDRLLSRGVPKSQVISSGKGVSNPIVASGTQADWSPNRRVEIRIIYMKSDWN